MDSSVVGLFDTMESNSSTLTTERIGVVELPFHISVFRKE